MPRRIDIKTVLDSVYNGVVAVNTEGRIFIFNRSASRFTKIPQDKAIGEKIEKLIPNTGLLDILKTQESRPSQKMIIHNHDIISNRSPIFNEQGELEGAIGVFQDISEVKKMAQQLQVEREMKRQLNEVIESSYDGIWIVDGEGYTQHVNSAFQRITGLSPDKVIGLHMDELIKKDMVTSSLKEVLNKKKPLTMMQEILSQGKKVLITSSPVLDDEEGHISKIVINVRDMTELIELKQELEEKDKLTARYQDELIQLRSRQLEDDNIVTKSPKFRQVLELALRVSEVDSTVLVLGESGVGKEVVAQLIARSSDRKSEPFIRVNCGAIPDNLLESELFGYEKGAFTGASNKGKMGMFELANKGTIFLDEVGEIPINLQVKLLRVIQEQEILRVGGTNPVNLDVRIIAATNRNLDQMVDKGEFRQDLYYRLNVVPIQLPPIRERKEDIPVLINHFLDNFNRKYNINKEISPEVIDMLIEYDWPGNVREIQNVIERLVVLTKDKRITSDHLPSKFKQNGKAIENGEQNILINKIIPLRDAVTQVEKSLLAKALEEFGSTRKMASSLGVDQSTIVRKLQKYNITKVK